MALSSGTRVGRYEVVAALGSGGMGDVYRARDSRLGREVALKMMPAAAQSDPDRQRRFEVEARAVAALSHPNVVSVFDVGEHEGAPFLVTELLEGGTLRDRLESQGAVPLRHALLIAEQLAHGLAAAHQKGIIHRDLKPENIFLARDGHVKILDFGLARIALPEADPLETTRTASPGTRTGAVLGTAGYMAPEQVQGAAAGSPADVFAFGAVLHELITGERAFRGESAFDKAIAIVRDEPRPLPGSVPGPVVQLLGRCLEKDPARRPASGVELTAALEAAARATEIGPEERATDATGTRRRVLAGLAIVTASLALAWSAGRYVGAGGARPKLGAAPSLAPQPDTIAPVLSTRVSRVIRMTAHQGPELFPSLSPDGTWLVYARRSGSGWDIFRQRVGGENAQNLTADSPGDDTHPAISPDGERIAFRSERDGGGVFVMGATGESVRRVSDFGYHPAWSPDGTELVVGNWYFEGPRRLATQSIWAVRVDSGARRRVHPAPTDRQAEADAYGMPAWSPHGQRIAWFAGWEASIFSSRSDGADPRKLTDGKLDLNPLWHPDGRSLWFASLEAGKEGIWRIGVDEAEGRATGGPLMVIPGLDKWMSVGSVSHDGRHLLFTAASLRWTVESVQLDPAPLREAAVGVPVSLSAGRSPVVHGDRVVFVDGDEIIAMKRDGSGRRKLTEGHYFDREPVFAVDGSEVYFTSERRAPTQIWAVRLDGGGLRQVTSIADRVQHPVPAPDGRHLALRTFSDGARIVSLAPGSALVERLPAPDGPGTGFDPRSWSRDGRWLAGTIDHDDGGQRGVAIWSIAEHRFTIASRSAGFPVWMNDSRRLLIRDQERLVVHDTVTGRSRVVLSVPPDSVERLFTISEDERWIYFALEVHDADVWMAELQ